jgi:hypothetical protein
VNKYRTTSIERGLSLWGLGCGPQGTGTSGRLVRWGNAHESAPPCGIVRSVIRSRWSSRSFSDLDIVVEERHEFVPRGAPQSGHHRVFLTPFFTEFGEGVQCGGLRDCGIDWLEVAGDRRPILLRGVLEATPR